MSRKAIVLLSVLFAPCVLAAPIGRNTDPYGILDHAGTVGAERMLVGVRQLFDRYLPMIAGSTRRLVDNTHPTAQCRQDPTKGCCPYFQTLNDTATVSQCSNFITFAESFNQSTQGGITVTTETITTQCSSQCVSGLRGVFSGSSNLTSTEGCDDFLQLKLFLDLFCSTSSDNPCFNTFQALVALARAPAAQRTTSNLVNILCTPCGSKILDIFNSFAVVESQVLNTNAFLPIQKSHLPFVCARDPNDTQLCLGSPQKLNDTRDPCTFCGRQAVLCGAFDLGIDSAISAILNCGCAEMSNGQRCIDVFRGHGVPACGCSTNPGSGSGSGNPSTGGPGPSTGSGSSAGSAGGSASGSGMGGGSTGGSGSAGGNMTTSGSGSGAGNSTDNSTSLNLNFRRELDGQLWASGGSQSPNLSPCFETMMGGGCSSTCAWHIQRISNMSQCCTRCLIQGFNITAVGGRLPHIDRCLHNLQICSVPSIAPCPTPVPQKHILKIFNLLGSWVRQREQDVRNIVQLAVCQASGCDLNAVIIENIIEAQEGCNFVVSVQSTSTVQTTVITQTLQSVCERNLMNLDSLVSLCSTDAAKALINPGAPLTTDFVAHAPDSASPTVAPTIVFTGGASAREWAVMAMLSVFAACVLFL